MLCSSLRICLLPLPWQLFAQMLAAFLLQQLRFAKYKYRLWNKLKNKSWEKYRYKLWQIQNVWQLFAQMLAAFLILRLCIGSCSFVPFHFLNFFFWESRFVLNIAYFSNIDTKTNSNIDTNTNLSCDTNAFSKCDKNAN